MTMDLDLPYGQAARHAPLLPSQTAVLEQLDAVLPASSVVALVGRAGMGKTRIAQEIVSRLGADYMDMSDYFATMYQEPKDRTDERCFDAIESRFRKCDTLILDDYLYLRMTGFSPRSGIYYMQRLDRLRAIAEQQNKTLILIGRTLPPQDECRPEAYEGEEGTINWYYDRNRTAVIQIGPDLEAADYRASFDACLGEKRAAEIDEETIYLHAPQLSIRQLKLVCAFLEEVAVPSTQDAADIVSKYLLEGNTRLSEVEPLTFDQLPGSEHIVEALETHVLTPLENPELAKRLGIRARRGVMLFGLPGTGKTAIGRALAHRMKGKFFMIDGSISTEPAHVFIASVGNIIRQAVKNAPCVLFIDDADNLFSIPHVAGIVRYLLSLLDGMESENASKVCVMMTVMDAAKVPDALTRSGRIELWLETVLPDTGTRERVLRRWAGNAMPESDRLDYPRLAALSEGLIPADIRRIMGDARLLYARDRKEGSSPLDATAYVERAIGNLRSMRSGMIQVLEGVRQ